MATTESNPRAQRPPTSEALIEEIRRHAATIDQNPFGRLQMEWQDGKPAMVEVTTKHRPAV